MNLPQEILDQLRLDLGAWGTSITFTDQHGNVSRIAPAEYFAAPVDPDQPAKERSA